MNTGGDLLRRGSTPLPGGVLKKGRSLWAKQGKPDGLRATYHHNHSVTYFPGCYSVGNDWLWGADRRHEASRGR